MSMKVEVAAQNWDEFNAAYDGRHSLWVKDARKFNKFYLGDQWEEGVRRALEAERRPVLTINEIMPTINAVLGEQSNQRVDIRFKPRLGGNEDTAKVLTHVVDHILDLNNYVVQEAQCFADGLISDVGYLDVRMDFERNVQGEVEIRSLDPMDVVLDPEAKDYDPKTWTRVFTSTWYTLDEIKGTYGEKAAKNLAGLVMAGTTYGNNSVRFDDRNQFGDEVGGEQLSGEDAMKRVRGIRVIEQQRRQLTLRRIFVDLETGDTRPVPDNWDDERVKEVSEKYGLGVMKKVAPRIRWVVSCDHVVMHDDWSLYEDFTVVPFFPFFRRGQFSGLVRQLISPQEQMNKIESQQLHVVNTTANSGYLVEEGSLANMTPEELEARGAETGLVVVYRKGRAPPAKIQPNQVPTGLDRLGAKAHQFIQEISGMESLLGRPPKGEVSGVAMERSESRALIKLQPILDNLERTRRLVAERVLKLVQAWYSETRVLRVTDWRDPTEPEVEVTINQPTASGEILNNVNVGTYDVIVGHAPARDGALETEFAEALQLMEVGVPVPPEVIIRSSHLANKHEIAAEVMKMQGRGEPSDEEAQMMQMQRELEMQLMQLSVQEMEAKIQKIQAEAAAIGAKAGNTEMQTELEPLTEAQKLELEMEKLRSQIELAREELKTKIELARINTQSRNAQEVVKAMTTRADTERKLATQREIAKISALSRGSKPTTKR
jgi:hypothetical protein